MAQHFLLSAKARTLSLAKVMRLSEEEAYETFKAIRWADNGGDPVCPRCGCTAVYEYRSRRIYKCKACDSQFSLTTATIFASRKLPIRDLLAAIAIFVNGAKGISALQLSRDLDVQYKTAFVLAHKLREVMGAEVNKHLPGGEVEVDGAYFGTYVRPKNHVDDRVDRRLKANRSDRQQVVVVMRERKGRTYPLVVENEADGVILVASRVDRGSKVYADEAVHWDALHAHYDAHRVNHSIEFSNDGVCTNQAESYFSRLRRMEIGTHHHVSGRYLHQYAREAAWREDHRREPNGTQYLVLMDAALSHSVSNNWRGYWQRHTTNCARYGS